MTKRYLIIFLLTISAITSYAQWTTLSGPTGGEMKDIEVDGSNKLYTVTNEKIFTSTNDGVSWTQLVPTTPTTLPAYDLLIDGTSLYVLTYSAFYKSDDGGANWTRLNSASATGQFYGVEGMIKIATNTFAIYGWNGVYVTSDGGINWAKINTNGTSNVVATSTGDLFMADQIVGVKKHAFTAGAWSAANVTVVFSKANQYSIRLGVKTSNNTLFLSVSDNIYKSTNGFATAPTSIKNAVITDPSFGWSRWTVAPDGKVYFGSHDYGVLYVTANDGTSWTSLSWPAFTMGNPPFWKILFTSATKGFAATGGDGIFKTIDGGVTWTQSNSGINFFRGYQVEIATSGRVLVSENNSRGYWYSDNAGSTWTFKDIGSFSSKIIKLPFGTPNALFAYQGAYYSYSLNNGDTWTTSTSYMQEVTFNTVASSAIAYGINGNVLYSTTNASVWTPIVVSGLPANYYYYNLTEDDGGLLYARLYNNGNSKYETYKITVTGATGTAVKLTLPLTPDEDQYGYINNFFVSNNKVYYATGQFIYYSADQGSTWGTISFSHTRAFGLVDGARKGICASSSGTLYVTQDDGQSWASYSLPATYASGYINDIAVDGAGDFYAATFNSPALKNTGTLLVDPATLPPYINFNWQSANGPWGGYIQKVFLDDAIPANTYAYKEGYLYKTTSSYATWTKVNNPSGYSYEYLIDRVPTPDKMYSLHWAELKTSIDGGTTWTTLNNESISGRNRMERCSNGDIAMVTSNNNSLDLYVSTNGGTTFGTSKFTAATSYINYFTVTSTAIPGIFFVYYDYTANQLKITRSLDRGATWGNLVGPIPTTNICSLSAIGTDLYITGSNNIYKSTDNGATWNSIKGDLTGTGACGEVYKSPTNELYTIGSSTGGFGFYKSTNNGTNWVYTGHISTTYPNIQDLIWNGTRMVVATSNGVLTSDDGGATYTSRSTGIPSSIPTIELTTPQRILGAGNGYFTYNLTDWTRQSLDLRHFYRTPNGRLFADTYNEFYETTDNGTTWTKVALFPAGDSRQLFTQDGTTFFAASYNKLFYTSNFSIVNNQTTWTEFSPTGLPAPNDRSITGLSVDPSGIIFVSLYNNVAQANEVYQVVFGTALKLSQIVSPRNIIYTGGKTIIYDGVGTIYSSPDGTSFTQKAAPGGDKLIITEKNYFFIPVYPGNLWLSRDEGQTWQQVGLNNSQYSFTDLVINEFNGYAYAAVSGSEVRKSASIVIPDDGAAPAITTLVPANNATNVAANTKLTITFDEATVSVATKKLRIFDLTNLITPVEEILATAGVQNGKTFTYTLTTTPGYLKTYFVVIESGAFKDIFGNAHAGILNNTSWRYTIQDVPDATAPTIAFTQANFIKGQTNNLAITVTDNAGGSGVSASTVKLFYRGIMSSAAATEVLIPFTTGSTYQIAVLDAWRDELGLEFYFTAADVAGNIVRSPTGTTWHYARLTHTETNAPIIPTSYIGVGGKAADYKMFSIPYDVQNASVGAIFNELGGADNTQWRIVQHINTSNSYSDATTITRGTGYWINSKTAPSGISIEGATTPNNTKTTEFPMALKPGWNLIGNPYPFTINWSIIKAGNVAIGDLKTFNGSFVTDNTLSPFEAGFVHLEGTQNATATITFAAKTGGRMQAPQSFEGGWLLPLTLEDGKLKNDLGGVGMHAQANISIDQFDDIPLPRLFDIPETHFSHPEYQMKKFTRDVVPVQDEFEWRFTADVQEGNEAVISWNYALLGTFDKELFLLDETRQVLVNMLEQKQYSFVAAKTATFKLYYGADLKSKIKPTSIMLGKPYPNPTQSSSSISFTLPENSTGKYSVVLDVYDMLGNKITNLANEQLSPGFHTSQWSPERHQISSGVYIYKLMVSDNAGKKTLTEKLVIQK